MQDKNFIKSIFRNGPSDLQIRKPAVLLSGNGVNKIIFHSTLITTGNIFSRKKLLTGQDAGHGIGRTPVCSDQVVAACA